MLAATLPIFSQSGLPAGADVSIHFWRTFDLGHSWAAGDVLARWSELYYTGYGAPSFAYTGGAFYALATVIGNVFGLNDVMRVKVAWALAVMLVIWGANHFAARRWGWAAGWVTAVALIFSPALYHTEALGRGSFGVILGFGGALAGLALLQDLARGLTRRVWPAAFCLGLMMLSHNLTAIQGAAIVGGWLLWATLFERAQSPSLGRAWLTFALGLGLSGVLWSPALLESNLTRLSQMTGDANLDFRNHFISLQRLLNPGQPFDARLINNPSQHQLGLPQLLLGVFALVGLILARRRWREVLPWLILSAASIFLVMPESRGLWERVTPLQQFLFPQRFLNPAAIGLALMGGFAISSIRIGRAKTILTLTALAACVGYGYFIGQARWRTDFPERAVVRGYFEYEQATGIYGGTSADEFLPPTVSLIPGATGFLMDSLVNGEPAQRINPYMLPIGTTVNVTGSDGTYFAFDIAADSAQTLEILQTYSPLWMAALDGQPVPIYPSEPYGFTLMDIPAGTHRVRLDYPLSGAQMLGVLLTFISVGGIVALSGFGRAEKAKILAPTFTPSPSSRVTAMLAGILLVGGVAYLSGGFQTRSEVGQARAAQIQTDLYFEGGQQLLGYRLNELQPGLLWELLLYWESPAANSTVNSFVHVLGADGQIIAQQDKLDVAFPAPESGQYIADRYLLRFESPPPAQTGLRVGLWACDAEVNAYDCAARRDLGVYSSR